MLLKSPLSGPYLQVFHAEGRGGGGRGGGGFIHFLGINSIEIPPLLSSVSIYLNPGGAENRRCSTGISPEIVTFSTAAQVKQNLNYNVARFDII